MSSFSDRLDKLHAGKSRPKSRQIADLLPEIEAALAKGISRAHVVEGLKAEGIEVNVPTLATYLQRLRKRQRLASVSGAAAGPPAPGRAGRAPSPAVAVAEPGTEYGQHDPRRLDEVMRSAPDMKAFAKLAKKGKP